jgi:hypothetical protein
MKLSPLTVQFLKENHFLTLNTKLFTADFKTKLLAGLVGAEGMQLDSAQSGLLVRGDNFHALTLLQRRFREKVKTVYGDPPYNAKSSEILYKNTYKHASWLSLMDSRIGLAKRLLTPNGVFVLAIDENEQHRLSCLLENHFSGWTQTVVTVVHNPGGIQGTNFSYTHEFAIFLHPSVGKFIGTTQREQADVVPLRDWGGGRSPSAALLPTASIQFMSLMVSSLDLEQCVTTAFIQRLPTLSKRMAPCASTPLTSMVSSGNGDTLGKLLKELKRNSRPCSWMRSG